MTATSLEPELDVAAMPQPSRPAPRDLLLSSIPGSPLLGWLGPLLVTAFALVLRLRRLSVPGKVAFDEVYYSCDALGLLRFGYERSHGDNCAFTEGPAFVVHPPLGKWLIAAGEQMFGFDSFGWRFSAVVFGTLSVLILCRLGRRMFRSTLLGCLAGLLLALDGLHFVQSRVAMLDIFLLFFVVAAAACLVVDRDQMRARLAAAVGGDLSYPGPKLGVRWWRIAAGVCIGAALATKWSAVFIAAVLVLVSFAWDVGARRTAGVPTPFLASLWRETGTLLLVMLVLPLAVYVLSWSGWFATDGGWRRTCNAQFPTECGPVAGLWKYHGEMWEFHTNLSEPHPYRSTPASWILLGRPVSYFYEAPRQGTSSEILAIGTPAIWWASILALAACAVRWLGTRDWRAAFILVGFAGGYLPWFYYDDRTAFLFYALPAVPFLCLALAYCAGVAIGGPRASPSRRLSGTLAVAGYLVLVVLNFFYLLPILSAEVIPYEAWQDRMWFASWI